MLVITIVSICVALVMTAVAWRAMREERRRSDARVAALAREIHGGDADLPDLGLHAYAPVANTVPAASAGLFATAEPSGSRWGVALAAGGLIVATLAAAAVVFSGGSEPAAHERAVGAPATQTAVNAPIELVALGHERAGDVLTVRGIVRNPSNGSERDRLTAVVSLFDRDGGFLTSGRAAVESSALIPGGESTFVVTVPATADVGRYRVSFQADDHVVSHIDKRNGS
jgi:hypothetical protein